MIKNFLKQKLGEKRVLLKKIEYYPLNFICSFFPLKKEILLESHPDLTCNTYQLFQYMLKKNFDKEYKLVWLVNEPKKYLSSQTVEYIDISPKGLINKFKYYKRCNRAAAIITSNRHIGKMYCSKKQLNIYLDHGSQLKSMANTNGRKIVSCDYLLSQSNFFVKYNLQEYAVNQEQNFIAGLPRNDQLFNKYDSLVKIVPNIDKYKKTVIWVPTFRQHVSRTRIDCNFKMPLGIPILYDEEDVIKINHILKNKSILLLIKPHPAQNMDVIGNLNCSNIILISNNDLINNNIQTNELLAQTDAMITDYSSIYYDYLLLNKPIAITLDDFNEYSKQKGFVFEKPLSILKGDYIYEMNDLIEFFENVSKNNDRTKDERNMVKDLIHEFQDSDSSERVYNFIVEKLKI